MVNRSSSCARCARGGRLPLVNLPDSREAFHEITKPLLVIPLKGNACCLECLHLRDRSRAVWDSAGQPLVFCSETVGFPLGNAH